MPSFNPFGGGKHTATLFEIRLENEIIVLRGDENEASSQMLRGVVVLCLPTATKVESVQLHMTGQSKVGWSDPVVHKNTIGADNRFERTEETFNHKWPPFVGGEGSGSSSKSITLPAANYEWPFEIIIPGSTPESVEGLDDVHVIYRLKATVTRGRLAFDLHAYKPVRIIRTLDPAALELSHAMTVENVWPNKVEYSLQIPQKAVVFGTNMQLEARFTPLLKGLKIGKIHCTLVESHEWTIFSLHYSPKSWKKSRDITKWTFEINDEDHYRDMINEEGQDGWVLNENMPMPKSLKSCMQDVDSPGIKIRHKVKFVVSLQNPDGHISELRASLPVTVFISPNMPIDESGNLLDQTPNGGLSADVDSHAPPLYGEHVLDQLYADMDHSGYRTPTPRSGRSTPQLNQSQSRSGSNENLNSTDGAAGNEVRPDALSSRLQNLDIGPGSGSRSNSYFFRRGNASGSGGNTPLRHGHDSSSSIHNVLPRSLDRLPDESSSPRSNPLSRRASEEDDINGQGSGRTTGRHTPEHIDYSELNLSQVPSYTTARRAPAPTMSYSDAEALPNYEEAISAPPSPEMAHTNLSPVAETPRTEVHVQNNSNVSGGWPRNPLAGVGLTLHRGHSMDADASRRLHLLQARGRVY